MWATWKKKRAHGFKVACGLASSTSFCVVQSNVSHLGNLSFGNQSNCWSLLASAPSPADQQAGSCQFLGSLILLLRVEAGQWLRWGKRKLCNVALLCPRTSVTDNCEWNSLRFVSSQVGTQCGRWLWCGWLLCLVVLVQSLVTGSMTFDHLF